MVERITDVDDPRLDPYRNLRDATLARHRSASNGLFIAEGPFVVERVLGTSHRVVSVVVLPERSARIVPLAQEAGVPVLEVSRETLAGVAGFDVHRGVLACVERPSPTTLADLAAIARGSGTIVACEGLTDAENLGAIIRSSAALGAGGLLIDATCADPLSRRAVRVSMGESLEMPCARVDDWPGALGELRRDGWWVIALTPHGTSVSLATALESQSSIVLMVGSEGPGLSTGAIAAADVAAHIPMTGPADSLNVAAATAIALYERSRASGPATRVESSSRAASA
ncbi:MAG: TrmH family RNA methyltransferase [Acidimicrobiia bacterium]